MPSLITLKTLRLHVVTVVAGGHRILFNTIMLTFLHTADNHAMLQVTEHPKTQGESSMSHSTVMVVVRADDTKSAMSQAELSLEPFNENIEVDPYFEGVNDDDVQSAVEFYTENDNESVGTFPITDDESVMRDWTARAVGGYFRNNVDMGAYENGKYGYMTTYNPDSKWDWYALGGRWRGYFQAKEGVKVSYPTPQSRLFPTRDNALGAVPEDDGEAVAILGESGTFGDPEGESMEGRADLIRKGDIDFDAMRSLAGTKAEMMYDKFESVTADLPVPPTWSEVRATYEGEEGGMDKARNEFNDYLWVQALKENDLKPFLCDIHDYWCVNAGGREAFIKRAQCDAVSPYAVLMDGQWHEKGTMGWFGMSSDEMSDEEWAQKVSDLIDGLEDDVWLAVYDIHI